MDAMALDPGDLAACIAGLAGLWRLRRFTAQLSFACPKPSMMPVVGMTIFRRSAKEDRPTRGDESRERNERAWLLVQYKQRQNLEGGVALSLIAHPRSPVEKLVASLKPLSEKLTDGRSGELLPPNDANLHDLRPVFGESTVIGNGGSVCAGLDSMGNNSTSCACHYSKLRGSTLHQFSGRRGTRSAPGHADDRDRRFRLSPPFRWPCHVQPLIPPQFHHQPQQSRRH